MQLDASLRAATVQRLMAAGVVVVLPDTVIVDDGVQVGSGTVLEPFTQLLGTTRVGSNCRIRSFSVVEDSTLGSNVLLRNGCILTGATVDDGALLGPYAHLRPGSRIGKAAHVGNFVETKNTTLGAGSKANHLTYLGDAEIGTGTNIGAGVITCNYDGVHKHKTIIGNNVFVGSDAALVAPVTLENGSFVAAGSCITEDVPSGSLALARSRQVTKVGWAASKAAKQVAKDS